MSSGRVSAAGCSKFTGEGGKLVQDSVAVSGSPRINVPYRDETELKNLRTELKNLRTPKNLSSKVGHEIADGNKQKTCN